MRKPNPDQIAARTREIRDAAQRVFVRTGVSGTTMQEIAAEAGLTAAAIYRYYPSKEDLLTAVLDKCVAESREQFADLPPAGDSPLAQLEVRLPIIAARLKDPATRDQTIMALESTLAAVRGAETLATARRRLLAEEHTVLAGLLAQAQAAGELRCSVDADALATAIQATIIGLHVLALGLGDGSETDIALAALAALVYGLAPTAPTPDRAPLGDMVE